MLDSYLNLLGIAGKWFLIFFIPICVIAICVGCTFLLIAAIYSACNIFGIGFKQNTEDILTKTIMVIATIIFMPLGYIIGNKIYVDFMSEPRVKIEEPVRIERFTLVEFDPPKHAYVTLKHEKSGMIYEHQYVAKHCTDLKPQYLGKSFNIEVQDWHYKDDPSKRFMTFVSLSKTFC